MSHPPEGAVLITVSGPDRPGITAEMTGILAQGGIQVLDIAQAVIDGLLSLSILFELPAPKPGAREDRSVLKDLLFRAAEMGLKLEFKVLDPKQLKGRTGATGGRHRYAVTLIAGRIPSSSLHEVTQVMARYGLNIDIIERLSDGEFGCVEMIVSTAQSIDRSALKKELLGIAHKQGVDIAFQTDGLYRRVKRLIVFDMDSTLIQAEVIDEFAREVGTYDRVAEITERAMRGEVTFDESFAARMALLKGLSTDQIESVYRRIQLTPGAEDLIRTLKKLGYKIALISGGFSCIADRLRDRLGIDYSYSNGLELESGRATGRVTPPIVNAQRKADLMDVIAQQERISLDQVIAVGDGANDVLMLERAGLGIAFNAKPVVRERADFALQQHNLRSILYLLGISGRDLAEILA